MYQNQKQKEILKPDLLDVPVSMVKNVFKCDMNKLPCIYLMTLGFDEDLRNSMNI